MAIDVKSGARFEHGAPKTLFEPRSPGQFDVSPDGTRFIGTTMERTTLRPMTLVINWRAGLKK